MIKESAFQSDDKRVTYAVSKRYAEIAIWEWADAHPDVDVTTSKSIILFFPKLVLQSSLISTPILHLRPIRTQVYSTSEA